MCELLILFKCVYVLVPVELCSRVCALVYLPSGAASRSLVVYVCVARLCGTTMQMAERPSRAASRFGMEWSWSAGRCDELWTPSSAWRPEGAACGDEQHLHAVFSLCESCGLNWSVMCVCGDEAVHAIIC